MYALNGLEMLKWEPVLVVVAGFTHYFFSRVPLYLGEDEKNRFWGVLTILFSLI